MKVTVTAGGRLDPAAPFFTAGDVAKVVYCARLGVHDAHTRLGSAATIVDGGQPVDLRWVSGDLHRRGVRRLLLVHVPTRNLVWLAGWRVPVADRAVSRARVTSFEVQPLHPEKGMTSTLAELALTYDLAETGAYLLGSSPSTLIHHDFDADNLIFSDVGGRLSVTVIDWQLVTQGHAAVDVGWLVAGQCDPAVRREHERDLVAGYHRLLVRHGVRDYSLEQCWDDYRLTMLMAVARLSTVVGVQPGPRGGFWDVVFPRYARASPTSRSPTCWRRGTPRSAERRATCVHPDQPRRPAPRPEVDEDHSRQDR